MPSHPPGGRAQAAFSPPPLQEFPLLLLPPEPERLIAFDSFRTDRGPGNS